MAPARRGSALLARDQDTGHPGPRRAPRVGAGHVPRRGDWPGPGHPALCRGWGERGASQRGLGQQGCGGRKGGPEKLKLKKKSESLLLGAAAFYSELLQLYFHLALCLF